MNPLLYGDDQYLQQIQIQPSIYIYDPIDFQLFDIQTPPPLTSRLHTPGVAGSYASTPGSNWTDIDVAVRVATNLLTGVAMSFASKSGASPNLGWVFRLNASGFLEFQASSNGTTNAFATTTSKIKGNSGSAMWLRAVRADSDGTVDFYEAADSEVYPTTGWSTVTLNRSTFVGSVFANNAPVEVGSNNGGGSGVFDGDIYRVVIRQGSTVVLDFDPRDYSGGSTWVSSATGELWTLNGSAAVLDETVRSPYWGIRAA